ncbi:MAG: hypothetical protein FJ286_11250 [Planctomycetes bacterium]|nr:hypothetical protein [Planctomycetota bacterium]
MRPLCTISCRKIALGVMLTACVAAGPAGGVEYPLVPVGNGGNANDTTGFGAVTNPFWIGKYEVTIGQYAEFLNAGLFGDFRGCRVSTGVQVQEWGSAWRTA